MKYFNSLGARIIIAVVIGFLFASAGTDISYTCAPVDGSKGCVSYQKAVTHLGDLASNKQHSLVRFSIAFALPAATLFILLSLISAAQKRKAKA